MSAASKPNFATRGDEAMQEARKAASTSMFKWKPDWEKAAIKYQEAAKNYGIAHKYDKQVEALEACAAAFEKLDSYHTVAKCYEDAARVILKHDGKKQAESAALLQKSSAYYRTNSEPDKSVAVLLKAAAALEKNEDVDGATQLYAEALAVVNEEGRGKFNADSFNTALSFMVRHERWDDAVDVLRKCGDMYKEHVQTYSAQLRRNSLALLVVLFAQKKYAQAEEEMKTMIEDQSLGNGTDEFEAANGMLTAYQNEDAEAFAALVKTQTFTFLPNQVARLARTLALDVDVARTQLAETKTMTLDADGNVAEEDDGTNIM
eukprot:TRINITY_DN80140_c0_g1_i1.p2 TRINITY_DN80140_c0_g1~~TRINITY_DN80140_c0_g1_i1.p2  ORF type:complete len:319 (-),score=195.40 TRINITY_DN80140_c0_g1_i1:50-1006(-)